MKHVSAIIVLIQLLFAAGCAQIQQVKVTYRSDPPGGTLYRLNGELLGPCPKTLWYDLDTEAMARAHLDAKGLIVRWPTGPEKASREVIRILTNVTNQQVIFTQPKAATETQTDTVFADKTKKHLRADQPENTSENPSVPQAVGSGLATIAAADAQLAEEMIKSYTAAAIQGDAEAQFNLGTMYDHGRGVPQDYKEAVKWFRKAAEQGLAEAQFNLGTMYDAGQGVAQDEKEAVKWFRKAAEQGHVEAHFYLGTMYANGRGVPQDYKEAVKWFRKAAEQGDVEAQYNLGMMYSGGKGVPQDDKEAVKWSRKAAEQGLAEAQFYLGLMYADDGRGVPQDDKEAVKWFRKAAEQGHVEAQSSLGLCYYGGERVAQDYKEAVKWFRKAAEQGLAEAQCNLGVTYLKGEGVLEDYAEAYKWFLLAAMNGHKNAQKGKELLRKKMTPSQIEEAQRRAKACLARDEEGPTEEKESSETTTEQPAVARGTGFLFARSGLVATNYHVISDGKNIHVYFPKADLGFDATVELKDINNDLAVLKIKDFAYDDIFSQVIPFGVKRSSTVQLGEEVFTLGFPLGELLGKSAKFSDGTISSLSGALGSANLFQINNPIQPGNSGGPLFDRDGNLIGIVVAILDAKFFYENLDIIPQNVNFAIKADYLINLISMLSEGPSILSRKGSLQDKLQEEQVNSLVPYIVTVRVR